MTCTYSYTGVVQTFTVPAGVSAVTITAYGGDGAAPSQGGDEGMGGAGGLAAGTFPVTAGGTLDVTVGQDAQQDGGGFGYGAGGSAPYYTSGFTAGGGGGSAVQVGGGMLLLAAGGGGGGGIGSGGCSTGGNGGNAGQNGAPGSPCGATAGGPGGVAGATGSPNGGAGVAGLALGGGGGGGGCAGGSGGTGLYYDNGQQNYAGAGGGGGGLSYADPSGTGVSTSGITNRPYGSNGLVTIAYQPGTSASGVGSKAAADTAGSAPSCTSAAITSGPNATFVIGRSGSFTVQTSGTPAPALSIGNITLPSGLTFTDNGNGTATLSGTPAAGTSGMHAFTITADNSIQQNATQTFTLIVDQPPALSGPTSMTFTTGEQGTVTFTGSGFPTPKLSVGNATLPTGVTFTDNGNGTATLSGTPAADSAGVYKFTVTASNGVSPDATNTFTLTVEGTPSVAVTSPVTPPSTAPSPVTPPSTVISPVTAPSNKFTITGLHVRPNGTVSFTLSAPGPGVVNVLETAWLDNFAHVSTLLNPAPARFVFARKHLTISAPAARWVTVRPNQRGRRLVAHHRYGVVIRLWVSYIPANGTQRDIGVYGIHLTRAHDHRHRG